MSFASYGTLLQMGDGATPENFATIAGVGDIAGPAISRDLVEVTSHSSEDGYEEQVPTIKRSGNVTFPLRWDPDDPTHDGETGILALVQADEPTNFREVYPRIGKMWTFSAYVTAFNTTAPVAGVAGADVTMKITGRPQLVAAAGS
jgi:hypothetical protein